MVGWVARQRTARDRTPLAPQQRAPARYACSGGSLPTNLDASAAAAGDPY
jgi:hypothetical protein